MNSSNPASRAQRQCRGHAEQPQPEAGHRPDDQHRQQLPLQPQLENAAAVDQGFVDQVAMLTRNEHDRSEPIERRLERQDQFLRRKPAIDWRPSSPGQSPKRPATKWLPGVISASHTSSRPPRPSHPNRASKDCPAAGRHPARTRELARILRLPEARLRPLESARMKMIAQCHRRPFGQARSLGDGVPNRMKDDRATMAPNISSSNSRNCHRNSASPTSSRTMTTLRMKGP